MPLYFVDRAGNHTFYDGASGTLNGPSIPNMILSSAGALSLSGSFLAPLSTTSAIPAFSFVDDPDTGFTCVTAQNIELCTAGEARMKVTAAGNIDFNETISFVGAEGEMYAAAGDETAPTYSFTTETDTGMYLTDTFGVGLSVQGTERLDVDVDGNVTLLTGDLHAANDALITGTLLSANATEADAIGNAALKITGNTNVALNTRIGSRIYVKDGTVTSPGYTIAADTDTGLYLPSADNLAITTAGVQRILISNTGRTVLNNAAEITAEGRVRGIAGSAAQPSYSFILDPESGIYSESADTIGFATQAVRKMTVDSAGNLKIWTGGINVDQNAEITGVLTITDTTESTNVNSGSIVINPGNVTCAKNVFIGGNLTSSGTTTFGTGSFSSLMVGTSTPVIVSTTGTLQVQNTTESSSALTGCVSLLGGAVFEGPLITQGTGTFGTINPVVFTGDGILQVPQVTTFANNVSITENFSGSGTINIGSTSNQIQEDSSVNLLQSFVSDGVRYSTVVSNIATNTISLVQNEYFRVCYFDLANTFAATTFTLLITGWRSGAGQSTKMNITLVAPDLAGASYTSIVNVLSNQYRGNDPIYTSVRLSCDDLGGTARPRVYIDVGTYTSVVGRGIARIVDHVGIAPVMDTWTVATVGAAQVESYSLLGTDKTMFSSGAMVFGGTYGVVLAGSTGSVDRLCSISNTGKWTVDNTDTAVFYGGVGIANRTNVSGAMSIAQVSSFGTSTALTLGSTGIMVVNNTIASSNATTGSAVFQGSIGIGLTGCFSGMMNVSGAAAFGDTVSTRILIGPTGNLNIQNTTASTSSANGCAVFAGGIGVVQNLNVSGPLVVTSNAAFGTSTQVTIGTDGVLTVTNTTESTAVSTGCMTLVGGLGLLGEMSASGLMSVSSTGNFGTGTPLIVSSTGLVTVNNTIASANSTTGCARFAGGVGINVGTSNGINGSGIMQVSVQGSFGTSTPATFGEGTLVVKNTIASANSTTGCVVFAGGFGASGKITTAGTVTAKDGATIGSSTPLVISSAGAVTIANTTDATSSTVGCATFAGGVGIAEKLTTDGPIVFAAAAFGTFTQVNFLSDGRLQVNNTHASANSTTGCAIFKGGIGVVDGLNVGGGMAISGRGEFGTTNLVKMAGTGSWAVNNTTDANNATQGCAKFLGGIGIVKNLSNSGTIRVEDGAELSSTNGVLVSSAGLLTIQNTTNASAYDTASALFKGNMCVVSNMNVGGMMNIAGTAAWGTTTPVKIDGFGILQVQNLTDSTQCNAGCAVFKGGIGIEGALNTSGVFKITGASTLGALNPVLITNAGVMTVQNTTPSTAWNTGCAIFKQGIGVVKDIFCAGLLNVSAAADLGTTTKLQIGVNGSMTVNNANDSTKNTEGAGRFHGGVGITGAFYTDGAVTVHDLVTFGTADNTPVTVSSAGVLTVNNAFQSTSSDTGSARFLGGVGVSGGICCSGTMNASGATTFGASTPASITTAGLLTVNSLASSTTTSDGCAVFLGGIGITGALSVTGNVTVAKESAFGTGLGAMVGITGNISLQNTLEAENSTTGALKFLGGIGGWNISASGRIALEGAAEFGNATQCLFGSTGLLFVQNATDSTAVTNGCAVFKGGVGVVENLYGADTLTANGSGFIGSSASAGIPGVRISYTGLVLQKDTTDSTAVTNGASVFAGGIGIIGGIASSGAVNIDGSGTFGTSSSTNLVLLETGDINSTNITESTDSLTGSMVFKGGVSVAGLVCASGTKPNLDGMHVDGSATLVSSSATPITVTSAGILRVQNTFNAADATTGAFTVRGGVGVGDGFDCAGFNVFRLATMGFVNGRNLWDQTGRWTIENSTESTTSANGCAVFSGGIGVAGSVCCSGTLTVTNQTIGGATMPWTLGSDGSLIVNSSRSTATSSSGCCKVLGGVGIGDNVIGGAGILVTNIVELGSSTPVTVSGTGLVVIQNTTDSTLASNGCATFVGGIFVAGNIQVDSNIKASALNAGTDSTQLLQVSSAGVLTVNNSFASADKSTGCAVFAGGVAFQENLNSSGAMEVTGTVSFGTTTPVTCGLTGNLKVQNTFGSLNSTTGCAGFSGGIGIAGTLAHTGTLNTDVGASFGGSTPTTISSAGLVVVGNTTQSLHYSGGGAVFSGGVGVDKNLYGISGMGGSGTLTADNVYSLSGCTVLNKTTFSGTSYAGMTGVQQYYTWHDNDRYALAYGKGTGTAVAGSCLTCWPEMVMYQQWTPYTITTTGSDVYLNQILDGAGTANVTYMGTSTIKADTWVQGRTFRLECFLERDGASSQTYTLALGGTTLSSINTATDGDGSVMRLLAIVTLTDTSIPTSCTSKSVLHMFYRTFTSTNTFYFMDFDTGSGINSTVDKTIGIHVNQGTGNTCTVYHFSITVL